MNCKYCDSEKTYKNGFADTGKQVYMCRDCNRTFSEGSADRKFKPKVGMTLDQFKDKFDVEHIVKKTLSQLDKDIIYQKDDIVKLAGISYGAQGLTPILEAQTSYYGKIGGKTYYSHPDTIKMLKEQAKLN